MANDLWEIIKMTKKVTEDEFLGLYMSCLGRGTFGNNSKALFELLEKEGIIEVWRDY